MSLSPLDTIRKRQVIVYGYIRKYTQFYPKEIIEIIYNFCFIKIFSYKIKTIGDNGNDRNVKTYQKTIKNIINAWRNIYIVFTYFTYECCGYKNTFVNIKINNIFSNPFSYHAFCIDNNNKIYECGEKWNDKWIQINTEIQIQKIATGNGYTTFINDNGQLFVCGNDDQGYGVLGLGEQTRQVKTITEIPIHAKFMDIYCGNHHTLALDCNGQIWSWGYGTRGKLGHGDTNNRYVPTKIQYFKNKNIQICEICCGSQHNLVLSNRNKIYAFGRNVEYQCVYNNYNNVLIPELNETLKNKNIITMKCGWHHNMVKNNKNEYYLWGDNGYNQCIVRSSNPPSNVKKPLLFKLKHFINKDEQIIDIFLGRDSTHVLIGNTKENNNV